MTKKRRSFTAEFIQEAAELGVGVMVHHRHAAAPMVLYPSVRHGEEDVVTVQIRARENLRRRTVEPRLVSLQE